MAALASGQLREFEAPIRFFWGKCTDAVITKAIFEGTPCPLSPYANPTPVTDARGLRFGPGGAWQFYARFWASHGLSYFNGKTPVAISAHSGSDVTVPLVIENGTSSSADVEIVPEEPAEWRHSSHAEKCRVSAKSSCAVNIRLSTISGTGEFTLRFHGTAGTRDIGTLSMKVRLDHGILPQ
jgi:hypothetical protein